MSELNILCGASIFAREVITESGMQFQYICDSNISKAGSLYEGVEIIPYDKISELSESNKINLFLANRYVTGTIKRLEIYFKEPSVKIYGFISEDFKRITEVTGVLDYYKKSTLIKKNIFTVSLSIQFKEPIDGKILLFTMGKVGTVSVKEGLDKALNTLQLQVHSLNHASGGLKNGIINQTNSNAAVVSPYKQKALQLLKNNIANGKKLKVITAVREPVARNLSFMFYMLPTMLYATADLSNTHKKQYAYTEIFEDIYYQTIDHDYILNWFDIELKTSLGIDIYEYPFDKDKGYSIIEKNNINLLVLKLEKLDNCASVIKEFANADTFELARENSSDDYWYKPIYDTFKNEFTPNEDYLKKVYESRFMKHFYSDGEIENFYKKWRKEEV